MKKIANYINGKLVGPNSNSYIDNYNPANGQVYSLIPDSNEKDVKIAIESAKNAFPSWSKLKNSERSQWLEKIANEIHNQLDELALASLYLLKVYSMMSH